MKPILFSTPMVQAIQARMKTQTRRIIPANLIDRYFEYDDHANSVGKCKGFTRLYEKEFFIQHAKYQIGDVLWVRETWNMCTRDMLAPGEFSIPRNDGLPRGEWVWVYKAESKEETHPDHPDWGKKRWKPSIFMPKEAARNFLKVTNVRVERLQDISEQDAIAEGVEANSYGGFRSYEIIHSGKYKGQAHPHAVVPNASAITSFTEIWESINGQNSWSINPWVFVYNFERHGKI